MSEMSTEHALGKARTRIAELEREVYVLKDIRTTDSVTPRLQLAAAHAEIVTLRAALAPLVAAWIDDAQPDDDPEELLMIGLGQPPLRVSHIHAGAKALDATTTYAGMTAIDTDYLEGLRDKAWKYDDLP